MYMYTQDEIRWKELTWWYTFELFAYSWLWQFSVLLFVWFSHYIITYECSMLLANLLQIIYCNMFFLLASAKWKTKWLFLNIMIIFCCKCIINFRFEFVLGTIMFYKCKKGFNRFSKRRILTDNSVTFRFSLTCFSCKYDQGILVNIFFKFCFLSLASI